MDKEKLDAIIDLHKAQPVGDGYIDIIVLRENCGLFVFDLIKNDFKITNVSWWEWVSNGKECNYGLGGPQSKYFNGWFAELPIDIDDIQYDTGSTNENTVKNINNLIATKTIIYPDEILLYNQNTWLTPAFWIDVPNDWKNRRAIT
jgi:hypothetical protein